MSDQQSKMDLEEGELEDGEIEEEEEDAVDQKGSLPSNVIQEGETQSLTPSHIETKHETDESDDDDDSRRRERKERHKKKKEEKRERKREKKEKKERSSKVFVITLYQLNLS